MDESGDEELCAAYGDDQSAVLLDGDPPVGKGGVGTARKRHHYCASWEEGPLSTPPPRQQAYEGRGRSWGRT